MLDALIRRVLRRELEIDLGAAADLAGELAQERLREWVLRRMLGADDKAPVRMARAMYAKGSRTGSVDDRRFATRDALYRLWRRVLRGVPGVIVDAIRDSHDDRVIAAVEELDWHPLDTEPDGERALEIERLEIIIRRAAETTVEIAW